MDDPYQIFYDEEAKLNGDTSVLDSSAPPPGGLTPFNNMAPPPAPEAPPAPAGPGGNGAADPYQQFYDEEAKFEAEAQKPQGQPDQPYTDRALTAVERLHRTASGLPDARILRQPIQQPTAQPQGADWTTGVGHIEGLADTTPGGRADQIPSSMPEGEPPYDDSIWPQGLSPILTDIWKGGVRESTKAALTMGPLGVGSLVPGATGKVSRGLIKGGGELAEGFLGDPDNLALIAATEGMGLIPVAAGTLAKAGITATEKAISAYFGYQLYSNLPERWKQFKEEKDLEKKVAIATQGLGELFFATQATKHAVTPGMPGGVARDLRKYDKAQEEAAATGQQATAPGAVAPVVPGPRFQSTVLPGGGGKSAEQPGVTQVQTTSTTQRQQTGATGAGQATGSGDNAGGKTQGEGEQGGVSSKAGPVKVGDTITYGKGEGVTWEVKGGNKVTTRIFNPETKNTVVLQNDDLQRKIDSGNIVHNPAEPIGAGFDSSVDSREKPFLENPYVPKQTQQSLQQRLRDKGYTDEQIAKMNVYEAHDKATVKVPEVVKQGVDDIITDVQSRGGQGTTEGEADLQKIKNALENPDKFSTQELQAIHDKAAKSLDIVQKGAQGAAHPNETRLQLAIGASE